MIRTASTVAIALLPFVQAAHASFDEATQKKYETLAGRVVSMADACVSLGTDIMPQPRLDQIRAGMKTFGAGDDEITEWMSSIVSAKSPAIRKALETEDNTTIEFYCTQSVDVQGDNLERMLGHEVLTGTKVLKLDGRRGAISSRWHR